MVTLDDGLVAAVRDLFPRLSRIEQRISVALYRLLAEGQPVLPRALAERVGLPFAQVVHVIGNWYGLYYDASGAIIGYWGLTLATLKHRFRVYDRLLYTWCAWDTLFLPELLDALAEVESVCPVSGAAIRLTVSGRGIEAVHPETTAISFVTPGRAKVERDVLSNFCHYVHFFRSLDLAEDWVLQHPATRALNLSQAWALGHQKNVAQYGETMGLEGRAT